MVNYIAILVCAVVGMIIGTLWHSKLLFGPAFMEAAGMDMNMSPEKMKEIQKKMWQLYLAQFVMLVVELYVLAHYVTAVSPLPGVVGGLTTAFWIWIGFMVPIIGGNAMWSARPRKMAWRLFFISAGYQLVCVLIFGAILGAWQ